MDGELGDLAEAVGVGNCKRASDKALGGLGKEAEVGGEEGRG